MASTITWAKWTLIRVRMAYTNWHLGRGRSELWLLGKTLLSSSVIHIWVRVVMLVRMIRTRFPAAVRAKSCFDMHSSWAMASSLKPSVWFLLWLNSHCWFSSKISGSPKNWVRASASKGIQWLLTHECMSRTPSSVGQALAYNSMTISGSNLAIGVTSRAQCLRAISPWKSGYSSSLSWTCLSLCNDHPLMASKHCWCSALWNRWLSNSKATLEPYPVAPFLDLFLESFFGAISCKKKNNIQEVSSQRIAILWARSNKKGIWAPLNMETPMQIWENSHTFKAFCYLSYIHAFQSILATSRSQYFCQQKCTPV